MWLGVVFMLYSYPSAWRGLMHWGLDSPAQIYWTALSYVSNMFVFVRRRWVQRQSAKGLLVKPGTRCLEIEII